MSTSPAFVPFLLRIADTNLILSQRLSEWTGHGPFLEEDLALTNIALDILGTARSIYEYASKIENKGRSEDDLAFLRNERQFLNPLICELPKGDYAFTICRQFIVDAFQFRFYSALTNSADETLAGIAAKAIKETTYHLRHTSSWMERFGSGTDESHQRLQNAINEIWRYTEDLFDMPEGYNELVNSGIAPEMKSVMEAVKNDLRAIIERSEVSVPEPCFMQSGSTSGIHTEHLGYLLAEMQYMQRMYPGSRW